MTIMKKVVDKLRRDAALHLSVRSLDIRPTRGVFSVSFDDIPTTAWTEAGPVLADHGVLATYYVCGGLSGGINLGQPQFQTEHLQALYAAGHEVGCHTYGHISPLDLSPDELSASLARNARWVAERLEGHVMQSFAYPYGHCGLASKRIISERFSLARGVRNGINMKRADRGLLQAIGLESVSYTHLTLPTNREV